MNTCAFRQWFEITVRSRWRSPTVPIEDIAASFGLTVTDLRSLLPHYTNLSYLTVYRRGIAQMKRTGANGCAVGFQLDDPPDEPSGQFDDWDQDWDQLLDSEK
jgi:hypothetical protein